MGILARRRLVGPECPTYFCLPPKWMDLKNLKRLSDPFGLLSLFLLSTNVVPGNKLLHTVERQQIRHPETASELIRRCHGQKTSSERYPS